MPTYYLTSPIYAVFLDHEFQIVMQLSSASILQVNERPREVDGLIHVECEGQRFAVFLTDLKQYGEQVDTTGSEQSRILTSQLLILQKAYSAALRNYSNVLGKRTLAVVTGDHEMARQLITSLEEVAASCTRAKEALRQHEAAAHSNVSSAAV